MKENSNFCHTRLGQALNLLLFIFTSCLLNYNQCKPKIWKKYFQLHGKWLLPFLNPPSPPRGCEERNWEIEIKMKEKEERGREEGRRERERDWGLTCSYYFICVLFGWRRRILLLLIDPYPRAVPIPLRCPVPNSSYS